MHEKLDCVIIGGGLSGLLAGTLLSVKGLKICILEKNKNIGGNIQPFNRLGYTFDTGMHFFGAAAKGQIQNEFFKILQIDEDIVLNFNTKGFKCVMDDKVYEIPVGFTDYENKLIEYFPGEKKGIKKYIALIKKITDELTIDSVYSSEQKLEYMETGLDDFLNSITGNNDLKKVLKFNGLLYNGDNTKCSLYIHAVITGSFLLSIVEFKKGTADFIEVLKSKIIARNGKIETSKNVISYDISNDRIISCKTSDGCCYKAETYLFSGHPFLLTENRYKEMIKSARVKRIKMMENTPGAFSIYVIMKKNSFKTLWAPEFHFLKSISGQSLLLHTPKSNVDCDFARTVKIMMLMNIHEIPGFDDMLLYKRTQKYKSFKKNKAEEIFDIIEKQYPGFKQNIIRYYTSTPLTAYDYSGSYEGSCYGIMHDHKHYFSTLIPYKTNLNNLYLTGQNINFHGMLGVSITTLMTCSAILNGNIKN
jgi:all-trans-retinol 13,14-reductase